MFGLSFGELVVLVIVAVVVIGPKELPKVLHKLGTWAGKLRRMAADLRVQSGIDDVLKEGGIGENLNEIRKLARGEISDIRAAATLAAPALTEPAASSSSSSTSSLSGGLGSNGAIPHGSAYDEVDMALAREREYPREGADAYHALPDTAMVYHDAPLPESPLAKDPLYTTGTGTTT